MPTVKFNKPEEFCEELKSEVAAGRRPDRSIVRVTNLYRPSSVSPNIRHVSVVATFSVEGKVTRLDYYCGDLWGLKQPSDEQVMESAKQATATIEAACGDLQLEVRGGVLEE